MTNIRFKLKYSDNIEEFNLQLHIMIKYEKYISNKYKNTCYDGNVFINYIIYNNNLRYNNTFIYNGNINHIRVLI